MNSTGCWKRLLRQKKTQAGNTHWEASVPALLGTPISGLDGVEVKDVHLGLDFLDMNPMYQRNGCGKIIHILKL